jgi:glycosyltransferase involved in cell wall biosynthesis
MSTQNSNRTYWIDLTDLYLWTGIHTGIQRTVYNLAKFYAARPDAKFFIYNEKQCEFFEIDFSAIKVPQKRVRTTTRRSELRDQVKYQLKTVYFFLPAGMRKRLTPVLKPIARKTYHQAHHTIHVTKKALTTPRRHKPQTPARFAAGDAVVIIGAGWIRPSIVTELWHRKQTTAFQVFHFIHDMIPTYHPHLFGPGHFKLATRYMFEATTTADAIITNSESSKRDTIQFMQDLHIPPKPVTVIRLGDELLDLAEPVRPEAPVEPGEYIFVDATLEIRKNHILLYTAYKLAKSRGLKLPKVIIIGRPGWHSGDVMYSIKNDPDVRDTMFILKDTSDAELVWLFQNCRFAVYPATYEGWGLPHAEALAFGKVSLTSSTSSLPEVAGDLVEYFNPFDPADCLNVLTKYLDPDFLRTAEQRIRAEYHTTSWQASYEQLDQAITELTAQLDGREPASPDSTEK